MKLNNDVKVIFNQKAKFVKLTQSRRARRHGREAADAEEEPRSPWGVVSYRGQSRGGGPTCRHRSFRRVSFYQKPLLLVYEEWHLEGKGGGSVGAGSQGSADRRPEVFVAQCGCPPYQ